MPTCFDPPPTAEQVLSAVDAVHINQQPTAAQFVASFTDMTEAQAEAALQLAEAIGFLGISGPGLYEATSPLCRFVATTSQIQRATVLRVLLESYSPFVMFRQRLAATGVVADAARETKALLGLAEHRDNISNSLISLGTFSQALSTKGAGQYEVAGSTPESILTSLMEGCNEEALAEDRVRKQLGADAVDRVSREQVIAPLANALRRAKERDSRAAVTEAGNAIESYLTALAQRLGVNLAGKTGIISKVEEIKRVSPRVLPNKLAKMGAYLGAIRNAADHGIDPEVNAQWEIRESTSVEYVFVACSFIATVTQLESGQPPQI